MASPSETGDEIGNPLPCLSLDCSFLRESNASSSCRAHTKMGDGKGCSAQNISTTSQSTCIPFEVEKLTTSYVNLSTTAIRSRPSTGLGLLLYRLIYRCRTKVQHDPLLINFVERRRYVVGHRSFGLANGAACVAHTSPMNQRKQIRWTMLTPQAILLIPPNACLLIGGVQFILTRYPRPTCMVQTAPVP